MEKIEFKDLPNTTTPIDADNLNLLQSNVENAMNSNIKKVFSKIAEDVSDTSFTFPDNNALYLVIAHANGNQIHCIFDIVYRNGVYYTRVQDTSSSPVSITITYNNGAVNIHTIYTTEIAIVEIPM